MNEALYLKAEDDLWSSVGFTRSQRRVTLPRLGVSVRVQEVGEGPPVLFVHGGPNAGATFAPMLGPMQAFRCILVDRPGTGLSEPFSIGSLHDLERLGDAFVPDVLDALGIERAHVVASSFGGLLALRSAAVAPERFGRMVQMACPAGAPGMKTPPFMRLLAVGPIRKLMNAMPPSEGANRSILKQIGHGESLKANRIPRFFFDWYLALQKHTDTMVNEGEMIGRWGSFFRGLPREMTIPDEVFRAVPIPTLFLWGADDAFGGADVATEVTRLMPNAELKMYPGFGHLPWLDDPEGIGAETAAFLESA